MDFKASVNLCTKPGTLKGFASISINDDFIVRGIAIRETDKGLFCSMPSQKIGNEYKDLCYPMSAESREKMNKAIIDAYEQKLQEAQEQINEHESHKRAAQEQNSEKGSPKSSARQRKADKVQAPQEAEPEETEADAPELGGQVM